MIEFASFPYNSSAVDLGFFGRSEKYCQPDYEAFFSLNILKQYKITLICEKVRDDNVFFIQFMRCNHDITVAKDVYYWVKICFLKKNVFAYNKWTT